MPHSTRHNDPHNHWIELMSLLLLLSLFVRRIRSLQRMDRIRVAVMAVYHFRQEAKLRHVISLLVACGHCCMGATPSPGSFVIRLRPNMTKGPGDEVGMGSAGHLRCRLILTLCKSSGVSWNLFEVFLFEKIFLTLPYHCLVGTSCPRT